MLDSIIFCSTLARRDSLHSLRCRCTLFLSRTPTFVNWALPANKPRVMCRLFIKNMLEKHTPIKEPVFYAQRGAGLGARAERAAAPLLAQPWWLLGLLSGVWVPLLHVPKVWLPPGGAGTVLASPTVPTHGRGCSQSPRPFLRSVIH